jgi:hypothetical protein
MWYNLVILCVFIVTHITHNSAFAGEAILSWDPPLTNEDGTPLTDLMEYKLYYGTSSGVYGINLDIGNAITYKMSNLEDGIVYYFAVTAYDASGNESNFSNEVSKAMLGTPLGNIDLTSSISANRVDGYDLIALEMAWGATQASLNWNPMADFHVNGIIDNTDMDILISNFGLVK